MVTRKPRKRRVSTRVTLDLPPEESAAEHLAACEEHGLETVYIVAPTTPAERLESIAERLLDSSIMCREGVTGEQAAMSDGIAAQVEVIKQHTSLPVVVGFGISTADHVRTVAQAADGVVVGSAIVNCIAANPMIPEAIVSGLTTKMATLTEGGALSKV